MQYITKDEYWCACVNADRIIEENRCVFSSYCGLHTFETKILRRGKIYTLGYMFCYGKCDEYYIIYE